MYPFQLFLPGMKNILIGMVALFALAGVACTKERFIESKEALLTISADTLHFDTVFTSTGSVVNRLKIFNKNEQKLRLSRVSLAGGTASFFKINVDGLPGTSFNNIEMEAGDSLYVFVTVTINPTAANLPFVVQDSLLIEYNGNRRVVQLDAFGKNARFLRSQRVSSNTSFNNNLPIVILGGLVVDPGVTLTIPAGCRIYAHANAPIIVNGSLKVEGKQFDSTKVIFRGDRLDEGYRDYPGSWPGIYFSETSRDNILTHAVIKNAYQGIITYQPGPGSNTKVILNECEIDNIYDAGILTENSSLTARNCLITNCGNNVALTGGGNYYFNHCTISSYSNLFINHKSPVLLVTNATSQGATNALSAVFRNCILFGDSGVVKNEIVVDKKGTTPFTLVFENVLYRNKDVPASANFSNSLYTDDPQFITIDNGKRLYNFRLKNTSPAVNKGVNTGLLFDVTGKSRGGAAGAPDIGAYEY